MRVKVPNINRVKSRGRTYFYHRKTGERLPSDPAQAAVRAMAINDELSPKIASKSVEALVRAYLESPEFGALAETTRTYRRYLLDRIRRAWGPLAVSGVRATHILALRDSFGDRPATANNLVAVLRRLFDYGIPREYLSMNPAKGIPALKRVGTHEAWTEEEVSIFRKSARDQLRLAFELGLHLGQRFSDVIRLRWADYDGHAFRIRQQKTGTELYLPAHADLKEILDARRGEPLTPIVANKDGGFYPRASFRVMFHREARRLGVKKVFHGLRKLATARLIEAGATTKEAAAITGHKTLAEIERYSRSADQKALAQAAMTKLESHKK